jgi:EAL domain-containing protein (putative c-di-GMP-specific phosphodiesterase class I)/CheY-like chemotaxis protein
LLSLASLPAWPQVWATLEHRDGEGTNFRKERSSDWRKKPYTIPTCRVALPRCPTARGAPGGPRSPSAIVDAEPSLKGHVLVADDEEGLREVYSQALLDAGLEVELASDTRAALQALDAASFDIVVSDIHMPGLDGIDFLKAIHDRDPDLPVILVTGQPSLDTAIRAMEHGAVQYLVKPVKMDVLVKAVERGLTLRRIAGVKREASQYLGQIASAQDEHAALEASLDRVIDSIWMAFQPIVRAHDGGLFGYEALLRSGEPSLPHPGAVFDAAEKLGQVPRVGRAVRECVARSLDLAGVPVFVNLHPLDLADERLLGPEDPLASRAENVVLEITERASLDGITDFRTRILNLRDLGYRIAVDDLGAGYAGLNTFAALEPDIVKLDMSLIRNCDREPVKLKLIQSMATLCGELGMQVVAEGIETESERAAASAAGCGLLQGYLIGRPGKLPS